MTSLFTRRVVCLLILLLVICFALPMGAAKAQSHASANVSLDKPYYTTKEIFLAAVNISNNSQDTISNARVLLTIKRADGRGTVFTKRWPVALPPGDTQLIVSNRISQMGLREGSYPMSLLVTSGGQTLAEANSSLVVLNPRTTPPLILVLVWNLNERAHFNPQGVFVDGRIQNDLSTNSEKPGFYHTFLSVLNKHPNIRANFNFSPLLLDQIIDISDGYRIKKNGKTREVKSDSREAKDANEIIDGYERLIKSGQAEVIPAPYAYPPLTFLASRGWGKDARLQIRESKQLISSVFNLAKQPEGIYAPGLELDAGSLRYLSDNQASYSVVDAKLFQEVVTGGEVDIYRLSRVQDTKGNRLTLFLSDSDASEALVKEGDVEGRVQSLIGRLAQVYLASPGEQKIVVIAPKEGKGSLSESFLDTLYTRVEQTPWVRTTTLKTATKMMPPPSTPLTIGEKLVEDTYLEEEYWQKLAVARKNFYLFLKMVPQSIPLKEKLIKDFLIAESRDWLELKEDINLANMGLTFVRSVTETVKSQFDKIVLPKNETVTLTSSSGKIPITVHNKADYKMRVSITVKGKGFSFPAGGTKQVLLKPKENLYTFPVKLMSERDSFLKIIVHTDDTIIEDASLTVKSAAFAKWMGAILAFLVILGIVGFWQYRRIRRKQTAAA